MAVTPVILKNSNVAGSVPATTDLRYGELAVNTTDGKIFLLRSPDGGNTEEIVEFAPSTINVYETTMPDNTTSTIDVEYVPEKIDVYVNGILLSRNGDYTANSGTDITFNMPLSRNDKVAVYRYNWID